MMRRLGIRWTIGDSTPRGFEALRLSIHGAMKIFGENTSYAVCVNKITPDEARARTGEVPPEVEWRSSRGQVPPWIAARLDPGMAEGVAWKFAPLHAFPGIHELSLDNDCILWRIPTAVREWLSSTDPRRCVLAEDVRPCFGQFSDLCGRVPRNTGIRGIPPGFDLEGALLRTLEAKERGLGRHVTLISELDEQGLQTAALSRYGLPFVVSSREVSICSPFPPHDPDLGSCGAHFVGINGVQTWRYRGRAAEDWKAAHWERHRAALYTNVGIVSAFSDFQEENVADSWA